MNRELVVDILSQSGTARSSVEICMAAFGAVTPEIVASCELLCLYSDEITCVDGKWQLMQRDRASVVLTEITNYSENSGKKIFRVASALSRLAIHEHPTEYELSRAVELSNGKFSLLPNSMIKRNS